jgi:hypothetical protein
VDFSSPRPRVIYERTVRTRSVSEIPHLYVKEMLDALLERPAVESARPDPVEEENWRKNPNLARGGDFEHAIRGVPVGWEPVGGQNREPLGKLVCWAVEEGNPRNALIRFTFDAAVGDNEGVMYYSEPFPLEPGAKYRFQCRWRTSGPAVKVFIKGYAEAPTAISNFPPRSSKASASKPAPAAKPARGATTPDPNTSPPRPSASPRPPASPPIPTTSPLQNFREVYRSQQNLKGPVNTWNVHTEEFTPQHADYPPRWGRVMLYAYLGGGWVEFDDVVVKQIRPAPSGK